MMNVANWKWLNESQAMKMNGEIAIAAPARTDWFNKRAERIPPSSKRSVGGGMNFGKARFFFCIRY